MLNKNYLLFILPIAAILLLPLLISSCKQPDTYVTPVGPPPCDTCLPEIDPPSGTVFACRINGKPFIAQRGGGGFVTTRFDYYEQHLFIRGNNPDIDEFISIGLSPLIDTGLYYFPILELSHAGAGYTPNDRSIKYSAEPIQKGYIHITLLDSIKMRIAGKFEFDLYSDDFKDTIRITDGRFFMYK